MNRSAKTILATALAATLLATATARADERGGWREERGPAPQAQRPMPPQPQPQPPPQASRGDDGSRWNGRGDEGRGNDNRGGGGRGGDSRGNDGRGDYGRDGRGGPSRDYGRDGRDDGRWDRNRHDDGRWDRDGRGAPRYDHDDRGRGPRYYGPPRPRWDAGPYYAPRGYYYRHWERGARLPPAYYAPRYVVVDPYRYGLRAAPRGCHWVRVGGDVILAAITTGIVLDVLYDWF